MNTVKKLTKAQWRELLIVSSWDINRIGRGAAMITYSPLTRWGEGGVWSVKLLGSDGVLSDSNLFYIQRGEGRTEALKAAQVWAEGQRISILAWERDPFGGWHPEGTMRRAAECQRR